MAEPVLSVRDLQAGYGGELVVKGVSLAVESGRMVAIIGPNGSGKSTVLKAIYGLLPERRGEVTLRDATGAARDISRLRAHAITALGVNMVPQLANVFPEMSVRENLEIGAIGDRDQFEARAEKVFATLPQLKQMLRKRAATLSGGQRQMLAVGRALMSDPRVLILDEPSAGLAPAVQDEVFAKLQEINGAGVSILMVEQRARQALAVAHFGYVLDQGRNRLEGPAQDLLHNDEVVRLYLGVKLRGPAT
ncbi:MAG: ABC transporter ATP-binding protein [Alphaproteobacteria bacterium]|nr:ABC transporter ATP-binding protein [Alphaproteobacteria bacterium]